MRFCNSNSGILHFDYATQYVAATIVSVVLLVEGMHYGWSSSAVPKLLSKSSPVKITNEEAKYITQMFTYGSITFSILSVANYPKLNHKVGVILSVAVMSLAWLLVGLTQSVTFIIIARFLAGIGRGLAYNYSTDYICEIADPKIRGLLSSLVFVMMNLGLFIIYSFGPHVDIFKMSVIGALISLSVLVAVKWVAESPYVLLLRGKTNRARRVLKSLRNLWNVEEELDAISEEVKRQDEENYHFWSVVTVRSNRKALLILTVLNALQVFCGINISIHSILKLSGGNMVSYDTAVVTSLTSMASCAMAALLLDVVGRKPILILSFTMSGLTLSILGVYAYFRNVFNIDIASLHLVPLVCLITFTMVYKMGVGMIPSLISSEIFPINAKTTASAINSLTSLLFSFGSIEFTNWVKKAFGSYTLFWCCAFNCFIGAFYTYFFVPETKGKTLHEIQMKLKNMQPSNT